MYSIGNFRKRSTAIHSDDRLSFNCDFGLAAYRPVKDLLFDSMPCARHCPLSALLCDSGLASIHSSRSDGVDIPPPFPYQHMDRADRWRHAITVLLAAPDPCK